MSATTELELGVFNGYHLLFVENMDVFLELVTDHGRLPKHRFLERFAGLIALPAIDFYRPVIFEKRQQNAIRATVYEMSFIKEPIPV